MEGLLAALEQTALAASLRSARWGYAAVNAAHILGIALLVGAIVPLDLKLMGAWPRVERYVLARVLVPIAACGLALAVITGALLFSVRATDYASLTIVWIKLAIIAWGTIAAVATHLRHGPWLEQGGSVRLFLVGASSLTTWLAALTCGRLIAFVN